MVDHEPTSGSHHSPERPGMAWAACRSMVDGGDAVLRGIVLER